MSDSPTANSARPRLLDQVRAAIRLRHYSPKTEESYVSWIRRFILFHGKRHPRELGETEVTAFLSDLAVTRGSSASTQNQALSAVLFLYSAVLGRCPSTAMEAWAKRLGHCTCFQRSSRWTRPSALRSVY